MKNFLRYSMLVVTFLMAAVNANAWKFTVQSPAQGTVTEIYEIVLDNPDGMGWLDEWSAQPCTMTCPGGKTVTYNLGNNNPEITSGYPSNYTTLTEPGTYTLIIPAGTFHFSGEGCESMTFTWTIAGSTPEPEATKYSLNVSPTPNGTVSVAGDLTQAKEGDVIALNSSAAIGYQFDSWNVTAGGNPVTVTNNTFTMPAADVTISATFVEANIPTPVVSYSAGIITITWPVGTSVSPNSGGLSIEGYTGDGYINPLLQNSTGDIFGGNDMIRIYLTLEDGDYAVVIPEGAYYINGVLNPYMRIPFTAGGSTTVDIYIESALFATFVPDADVDMTSNSDVEAYVVTDIKNGYINLAETTQVPANNAVIVKSNSAGKFSVNKMSGATLSNTNLLKVSSGITVDLDEKYKYYVLGKVGDVVGFYPVKVNTTIAINKGYLEMTDTSAAKPMYGFSFDGTTTGVQGVIFEKLDGSREVYDLQGRRLQQMQKGINIVNGKKVLVK